MRRLRNKLWLGLAAIYLALFCLAEIYSYRQLAETVRQDMRAEARKVRALLMATRRVYHLQFLDSGLPLTDRTLGFLPAHALSRISREFQRLGADGASFNNVAERARNAANRADRHELEAMRHFRAHPRETEWITVYTRADGVDIHHYTAPIRVEAYCLACHGRREDAPPAIRARYAEGYGYRLGDLLGVMSIKLPAAAMEARLHALWRQDLGLHLAAFGLAFLAGIWLFHGLVLRPLKRLRVLSERLARGDYQARGGLAGNDELGALGRDLDGLAQAIQTRDQALREGQLRFEALFRQQVAGMALLAPDGRFIEVNERLSEICGFGRDELHAMQIQTLTHPEDAPATAELVRRLLAGEIDSYMREERCRHKDGHWVWVNHTLAAVHGERGVSYSILTVADITDRKRAEALLAEERERVRLLLDSTAEAIYGVNQEGLCTFVNHACLGLLGYAREEDLLGRDMHAAIHHHHDDGRPYPAGECRALSAHREGRVVHVEDEVFWRRDGIAVPVEYWSHPIRRKGELIGAVVTFLDITERQAAEARLWHQAHHDALTGLPNRMLFNLRLAHALDGARRHVQRLALLSLDVDRFKTINDSFGHPLGNELLVAIARRLRDRLRDADTLARPGGDEFVILLEQVDHTEDVSLIAQDLLALMEAPFTLSNGQEVFLSVSIGASLYPEDGHGTDELVRNADAAMYQAKEQGRNACRFYTRALTEAANARLALETRLRHALERGELELHYQPLLAVEGDRLLGVEALARWPCPGEAPIPPDRFIPLAEETGLILPLGEWVLRQACAQAARWRQQGRADLFMAVNLSPRQFRRKNLAQTVAAILGECGLPAHCLELEITEGAIMDEPLAAESILHELKRLGVRLAIDDFGTGYSSLASLKRFPIDKLKIDKGFVRDIPQDHDDCQIAATIIAMARNLKLEVLAEGVETEAQLAFLREHGCDTYQGYLASRPLPAEALGEWIGKV